VTLNPTFEAAALNLVAALPKDDLDHAFSIVGERWQQLRGQRIFLTGGTGFIGKWLLATLLDAERRLDLGCHITILTRDPDAFRNNFPHLVDADRVKLVCGDVRDFDFNTCGGGYNQIVHAATDVAVNAGPLATFDTCVQGTHRVLDFAVKSGVSSFLLISSGAVYGRQPDHLLAMAEDFQGTVGPLGPASAYTKGKQVAEWLAGVYAETQDIRVTTARCFAFVGPYLPLDKHFAIGNFLRDAMAHRPICIRGDGTAYRSYLHASDMAAWLWSILLDGTSMQTYNVGGTEAVSISHLAQRVVTALHSKSVIQIQGQPLSGVTAERYLPSVELARSDLLLPEPIGLDDAIVRTACWYRKHTAVS
jgi:dTDP-glucose 4,6-dehydratase